MVSKVARRWQLIFHQWNSLILTNQRNGLCDKFDDYFTFRWNTLYMNVWNSIGDYKEQRISRQIITDL